MTNSLIQAGLAPQRNGLARLTRRDASNLSVCFTTSTEKLVQFVASFSLCYFFPHRLIPSASNSMCFWKRKEGGDEKLEQVTMLKKRGNKKGSRKKWRSAVSWHIVHRKQLLLAQSGDTVWWLDQASAPCILAPWAVSATGGLGHRCPGEEKHSDNSFVYGFLKAESRTRYGEARREVYPKN